MITSYHVLYDENAATENKLAKKIICYLYGSESSPVATEETDDEGCTVYDYGEYGIECEYVGGSVTTDLAVIHAETQEVKAINFDVRAAEFADEYHVGQSAVAIENSEAEEIIYGEQLLEF